MNLLFVITHIKKCTVLRTHNNLQIITFFSQLLLLKMLALLCLENSELDVWYSIASLSYNILPAPFTIYLTDNIISNFWICMNF